MSRDSNDGVAAPMRVMDSLSDAIQHTRQMLFEPFEFERWLMFGVIAFLDVALAGGGLAQTGGRFSFPGGQDSRSTASSSDMQHAMEWIGQHFGTIILVAVPLVLIVLAIHIALLYVGCRGQVMFVRAVALNGGRIGEHWSAVKDAAFSLFAFRLVLLAIGFTSMLVILALAVIVVLAQGGIQSGEALLVTAIPFVLVFLAFVITFGLIHLFLRSFVVPLMWARDLRCVQAWHVFLGIARDNVGPLLLYVIIKIAYGIGFAFVTLLAGCLTCCIGWIPVIHHVLFAPYYVFDRAFSMEMLASTGRGDLTLHPGFGVADAGVSNQTA